MEYCFFDQSYRSKRAFTLIELLVVISIIAVLMAIMMPALAKVKAQATMVVCKTRLKDLGTSMNMYVVENNGCLTDSQALDDSGAPVAGDRWMQKLAPYYDRNSDYDSLVNNTGDNIYNFEFYRCPTQKKLADRYVDEYGSAGAYGCYGYNIYFTNYLAQRKFNWRKASAIKSPGSLPLMADSDMDDPYSEDQEVHAGWRMDVTYSHPSAIIKYGLEGNLQRGEFSYFGPAPNHDGKTNYLFADGHCESLGLWPWSDHLGTDFHPVRNVRVNP